MTTLKKPEANPLLNPVDFFNLFCPLSSVFTGIQNITMPDANTVILPYKAPDVDSTIPTFTCQGPMVTTHQKNPYRVDPNTQITKFMLLTAVKFKGDFSTAISHVMYDVMKLPIPYIRVGTTYFKVVKKYNRFGLEEVILKTWNKEEIRQDHGKDILDRIYKFDDFIIEPNNINYSTVVKNCYNQYNVFQHNPIGNDVTQNDIPNTMSLLTHIFGEQLELGLKYMKVLYEHPKQILPVLTLTSTERETGKTTFLNWIMMLFGSNSIVINPADLTRDFNDTYATKNIVMIDETVIDKVQAIEKLKSIATAKTITVSQKFVQAYSLPFFGKIILCTNKESDFMRIDEEEIRFWVRHIGSIPNKNTNIENDLLKEIPLFLKYLLQLPDIDFTKSRMVFTLEEIKTDSLITVKEESKSTLRKEIEYLIRDLFDNHPGLYEIELTPKDIKDKWFTHNNNVGLSYIRKVLKEEMRIPYSVEPKKYRGWPDAGFDINLKTGRVYVFKNPCYKPEVKNTVGFEDDQPF